MPQLWPAVRESSTRQKGRQVTFEQIASARLRLVPFDEQTARAVLDGDLTAVAAGPGWPQEGTTAGLSMAAGHGDRRCGIHGLPTTTASSRSAMASPNLHAAAGRGPKRSRP